MSERENFRIQWLDGWRGLAAYLMIVYHLGFDLVLFGWAGWSFFFSVPMSILERFISFSFIACAGISCRFSRSNLRRGVETLGAGLIVIGASLVIGTPIWFGILQLLAFAMLFYGAAGKLVRKIPDGIQPFLWVILYIITKRWTDSTVVGAKWLFWLGFQYKGFQSYDYFPVFPYLFLFLFGAWMGGVIRRHPEQKWQKLRAPAALTWPGKHTLMIYLLHQPVLYAVCWVVKRILA